MKKQSYRLRRVPIVMMSVAFLAGVLLLVVGNNQTPVMQDLPAGADTEQAPDFTLPNLKGEQVSLSDFSGKVVFLNFWATWCPPCKAEMPSMEELHQQLRGEGGFKMLAVSVDQVGREKVADFIHRNGYTFEVLHDQKNEVMQQYGVRGIPTTLLIDQTGNILLRQVGEQDWANETIVNSLKGLVAVADPPES